MLLIVLGFVVMFDAGCSSDEGEKGVKVGGAVEDPEIEAINRGSSEIPIQGAQPKKQR